MTITPKLRKNLDVLAIVVSMVAMVVAPAITWAATRAVESYRVNELENSLDRIAETLAAIDRRLAYIEGQVSRTGK